MQASASERAKQTQCHRREAERYAKQAPRKISHKTVHAHAHPRKKHNNTEKKAIWGVYPKIIEPPFVLTHAMLVINASNKDPDLCFTRFLPPLRSEMDASCHAKKMLLNEAGAKIERGADYARCCLKQKCAS